MTTLNSHFGHGGHRVWIGGFNLLPYRRRNARRARRRLLIEWLVAALCGSLAVLGTIGWQAFERARLDAQHASSERALAQMATPLAEHARLSHDANERSKRAALASTLSSPLTRLLDLLDTLSNMPAEGVILQQLRQRVHETELLATSNSPVASADWLKQLDTVRGVKNSEVTDLHPLTRAAHGPAAPVGAGESAQLEFAARLRWDEEGERGKSAQAQQGGTAPSTVMTGATAPSASTTTSAQLHPADHSRGAR
ncbi:fimbrial assembly protein [Paraburkholderia sp. DHOC27]|uniref:fimbrial assembly protein n=1 Tax=Paraburkholderia sp. DHOC27 TaxID=2303330 RepID=UPI000E3CFB92|nr:fimbrial assembly protein [Paraburkholderia sp. DHOC27]RFU43911.1 fimbrial assembly protein [Paraburkholderia sp. DHOC27]